MKVRIVNNLTEDSFIIEGKDLPEVQLRVWAELGQRGWTSQEVHSEVIED